MDTKVAEKYWDDYFKELCEDCEIDDTPEMREAIIRSNAEEDNKKWFIGAISVDISFEFLIDRYKYKQLRSYEDIYKRKALEKIIADEITKKILKAEIIPNSPYTGDEDEEVYNASLKPLEVEVSYADWNDSPNPLP